jgi:lipopolysaccharide assembly outer membrane protein LptD (OstA)
VYFDAELRLVDWMAVNFDAALNLYEPNVDTFNLQTWLRETGPWRAYLEYRFQDGDSSLLSGDVTYAMNRDWSFNSITRYELDESQLEEQALRVQRMLDCMVIRLGLDYIAGYVQESGDTRDDEYRVMAEVWLTAFPNVRLGTSQRN